MLKSNMMKNDFDSESMRNVSSYRVGSNGEIIQEYKSEQTSNKTEEHEEVDKNYEPPKIPNYNDPNQIYEDSNKESQTFDRLEGELNSEQSHIANEANNAADLEEYIRRDYSYDEGDYYDYKGDRYLISDIDDPVNLLMTSERAEQLDRRKEDSDARIFDSLLSNWDPRK